MLRPARLLVAAVCAVVLVFVARAAFRRNAAEPPPARAAAAQHERVPAPAPVAADGELREELPPDHEWGIPPPTAPWMTAPADPIVVSVTPGRRQNEAEITPGGGKIEVANERATFTLFIPRGALLENQEITLTVVDQIANLPFAGGVASAVQIAPAHALFLSPVGLTIEPRRRTPADAKQRAAGFSVSGDPAELHLYPVRETTEVTGRVTQDRVQFAIRGGGIYGAANATEVEVRDAAARLPSDAMARLEVSLAKVALRTAGMTLASARPWSLWPVLLAQTTDDQKFLNEAIAPMVQGLRDYYDQRLMPKLQKFEPTCAATAVLESRALHRELFAWIHAVQLLGLSTHEPPTTESEDDRRLRESMPITWDILQRERAANEAYFRPLSEEFEQREARLWSTFFDALKRMYAAILDCCAKQPRYWMPAQLVAMQRLAESTGRRDIVGGSGLGEVQRCACAVSAVFHRKGWEGSITHSYTVSGDVTEKRGGGSQTVTESGTHTTNYTASISLMGADENDDISAYASANGTRSEQWRRVESGSSCGVNEAGRSDATSGTSVTRIPVSLSFRPNRQYSISYAPPVAYGLSQKNEWTKLQQCANRFANSERNNWYLRPGSVTGGDSQPLRGETDNQLQLSGSTTYEPPGSGVQQRRQVTVTWQLRACEGS